MNFKDKCTIINYLIALAYQNQWMIGENEKSLLQYIQISLNRLSPELKEIIVNDFIELKDKLWYLEFYSKSSYYRLKNEAMTTFLNCLGV